MGVTYIMTNYTAVKLFVNNDELRVNNTLDTNLRGQTVFDVRSFETILLILHRHCKLMRALLNFILSVSMG